MAAALFGFGLDASFTSHHRYTFAHTVSVLPDRCRTGMASVAIHHALGNFETYEAHQLSTFASFLLRLFASDPNYFLVDHFYLDHYARMRWPMVFDEASQSGA